MNKDTLILGKGFVGGYLQNYLDCRAINMPINSYEDAAKIIKRHNPKVVINCIGITGKRSVDDCESDIGGVLLANSFIPIMLAEVCLRNNIKLVHISSGCLFNFDYKKDKPIKEGCEDYFFKLFYSRSKIYSGRAIEVLTRDYNILIVRIRVPLLDASHPKNLLDKLIKYGRVIDIPNSVTYIPDLACAVKYLISIDARGVYNVAVKGGLHYPELMKIYQRYVPSFKFETITQKKLGLIRTDLILSTAKLERTGFRVRNVNSILEECVKGYIQDVQKKA